MPVGAILSVMSMRSLTLAAAVCFSVLPIAGVIAGDPATTGSPAAAPKSAAAASPASSGDAAAKHAKRTACLKDAKAKKLVGAAKSSFIKRCAAAP